jgi:hypothetical protein
MKASPKCTKNLISKMNNNLSGIKKPLKNDDSLIFARKGSDPIDLNRN